MKKNDLDKKKEYLEYCKENCIDVNDFIENEKDCLKTCPKDWGNTDPSLHKEKIEELLKEEEKNREEKQENKRLRMKKKEKKKEIRNRRDQRRMEKESNHNEDSFPIYTLSIIGMIGASSIIGLYSLIK